MNELRYHCDPESGQPHIYDHGVTEQEVAEVFADKWRREYASLKTSRVLNGQTAAGRYLKVIYVPDLFGPGIFVITAYDLIGKPLKAYRRQMRRRRP
ncbi:MAG TPA: hypothetical protein VHQ47_15095 [Phycisphaerae bacterium]|jgi:hypothetical protein|nr:hypothetical protein [Phycisphaerae bacterium]